MAEIKHYIVSQTRKVPVTATSMADAVQIAEAVFDGKIVDDDFPVWGRASVSDVKPTNIMARLRELPEGLL